MKKVFYALSVLLIFCSSITFAQIQFQNPSFEGTPQPHITPAGWDICMPGVTPDTQPGSWGITLPPSNGSSYLGLVYASSINWQEGAGQDLTTPLVAGNIYSFSLDLATPTSADPSTGIVVPPNCAQLQLWGGMSGGNSGCDQSELLWTSPVITHANWQTYSVGFSPTSNWNHLLFLIYIAPPACTDGQYLLVDNISNVPTTIFSMQSISVCANPATISANAGFSSYLWSNGSTTQSTSVTASGNYYVTATLNSQVYVDTLHVTLTQPYLNLNLGNDVTSCGSTTINLNAGNGFSNYLWNTGATAPSINVNQTGSYSVQTSDTGNCIYNDQINVIINPSQSLHLGNDTTLCHYGPLTLDAGIAFDSYLWSTGASSQSIQVNTTGTYYVTATNTLCSTTVYDTITCIFYPVPNANAGVDDTICAGSNTILHATGGGTYLWTPSSGLSANNIASPTANPIYTTTYTVTIGNVNGCTASDNVSINVFNASISVVNSSCGMNNGAATAFVNGGSLNNTYIWSTNPPQTTQGIANLAPGSYSVTITDLILGCNIVRNINVTNVAPPVLQIPNIVNASCGMNNGSINLQVSGGTPPYSYLWNSTPNQISQDLLNVPQGYYCVTVTDAPGCTSVICDSVIVDAWAAPEICMVTVDTATNHNMIIWNKPVTTGINFYMIFRETNVTGVYNMIGTQPYSSFSTFIDVNSNASQQPYRYKLAINDNCGFTSLQSNYHQTLHLTISAGMGGAWNLNWNNYEGFAFSTYNIYRGTNNGNMVIINSVANNVNSYTDLTPPGGTVVYMVEAVRPTPCNPTAKQLGFNESTISNIANSGNIGIDEGNSNEFIQIYPNPASGNITITLSHAGLLNAEVEILNSLGQVLFRDIQSATTQMIDISGFAQGVYLVRLKGNDKTGVIKFVKE